MESLLYKSRGIVYMAGIEELRHSCAHLLAAAVLKLYPDAKRAIGPPIEDGFYYDFEFSKPISESDLPKIEKEMYKIVQTWKNFEKKEVTKEEAKKLFKNNPYKLELIEEFSEKNQKLTIYKSGDYIDLCRGGHIENPSKELRHFKLLKLAGAYWRGNEKNKMLTRIYGTAFPSKEELDLYLKNLEEAKKIDHRMLGEKLNFFFFHEYSPGSPIFLPKGTIVYHELMKLIREEYKKRNYREVITPLLYEKTLWKTSGHWQHYKENMFNLEIEKKAFSLKPMNCPSHCLIYKNKLWSYKELPLRIADFAALHRNELSGTLGGLTRVRKLSQDDAHIFLAEEQLEDEIKDLLDFVKYIYKEVFSFEYEIKLSTKPGEYMGEDWLWERAENSLKKVLEKNKIKYKIAEKEGAFYGPKIDIDVKDALNRSWQLATIQLDFQLPLRFNLTYEGKDGKKHTPIIIHRAILGSIERFIAVLIENYSGNLPVWLSPVQVVIITVADRHIDYAEKLLEELKNNGIRAELDSRTESIGKKAHDHQIMKIPYLVTIGDKEIESKKLAVKTRGNKINFFEQKEFIEKVTEEIKNRK